MDEQRALNIAIYGLIHWSDPSGDPDPVPWFGAFNDDDVEVAIVTLMDMRDKLRGT